MPTSAVAPPTPAPTDLAWRVVGLVNLYRLLVPLALLAVTQFGSYSLSLSDGHRSAFYIGCVAYFIVGVLLVLVGRARWPSMRSLALAHAGIDILAIAFILWSSGGVASGFGILLVVPIGAMALLAENRDAFFLASMAAIALLAQQIASHLGGTAQANDYILAGVLGAVVFLIALSVRPLANRLIESEAVVRRQEVDLANLAQLSQYIVQHLRESILVVDEQDRVRLINESAAHLLGDSNAFPGALLGEASPRLLYLLSTWRQRSGVTEAEMGTFTAADGARAIQPHFASLGIADPAPVLIFLEDTTLIAERVQQSKLAALGRLSASIAHEIRNPVGAMSHAGQLLAESPALGEEDLRLTTIIRSNADRVSTIIENVLQLSRRGAARPQSVALGDWLEQFREEFCETLQWPLQQLTVDGPDDDVAVRIDPTQLRQVVWNLTQNAMLHGSGTAQPDGGRIELRFGRLATNSRPYLEVADRGVGIPQEDAERVFEPFFTRATRGTGLGLFLARELAQTNGATLLHEPRAGGGSIFRLVFTDPGRWEA
jgi:two-component system sensor histidine kinase PilS (NtrC family)